MEKEIASIFSWGNWVWRHWDPQYRCWHKMNIWWVSQPSVYRPYSNPVAIMSFCQPTSILDCCFGNPCAPCCMWERRGSVSSGLVPLVSGSSERASLVFNCAVSQLSALGFNYQNKPVLGHSPLVPAGMMILAVSP